MRIKKYTDESMPTILTRIKHELGEEAIILHVRKIKDESNTHDMIEVTAAVDPPASVTGLDMPQETVPSSDGVSQASTAETAYPWTPPQAFRPMGLEKQQEETAGKSAAPPPVQDNRKRQSGTSTPLKTHIPRMSGTSRTGSGAPKTVPNHPDPSPLPERSDAPFDSSTREPKLTVVDTADSSTPGRRFERVGNNFRLQGVDSDLNNMRAILGKAINRNASRTQPHIPITMKPAYERIIHSGMTETVANRVINELTRRMPVDRLDNLKAIEEMLLDVIAGEVACAPPPEIHAGHPTVITLVGPTGVGKTTTLAKLAANAKLLDRRNVSLISADTYRVGAIHQLRTFAYIADIPLSVAYNPDEVHRAIQRAQDTDIIFIDTVGRSQRMSDHIEELKAFIDAAEADEVHLVLSATAKDSDLLDVIKKFSIMGLHRIVMTKLDETTTFGTILNVLDRIDLPLSYVTTGQSVPDDIEQADPGRLAQRIMQGGLYAQPSVQVA